MRAFILLLFLLVVSILASSQDDRQAMLIEYIEVGDLENVKALISPAEAVPLYSDEQPMDGSSAEETRPTKMRRLAVDPHPATLDGNRALYCAIVYDRTEIVAYLLGIPEVRASADFPDFIATAIDDYHNGSALELLNFATPDAFVNAFILATTVQNLELVKMMIDDARLDLNPIMLVCISNMVMHKNAHEMIRFFMTHPKAKATDCDKSCFLDWALHHRDISLYLLYLEQHGFDHTRSWIILDALKHADLVWAVMLIAHPNVDLSLMNTELLKGNVNFSAIINQMIWFMNTPLEELTPVFSQLQMCKKHIIGALFTVACLRGDHKRLELLMGLGKGVVSMDYLTMTILTLTVLNHQDIFRTLAMADELYGDVFEDVMNFCVVEFFVRHNTGGLWIVLEALKRHSPTEWISELSFVEGETDKDIERMIRKALAFQPTGAGGLMALSKLLVAHLVAMQAISEKNYLPQEIQDFILFKSLENLEFYFS